MAKIIKVEKKQEILQFAVGRRKRAVARVRMVEGKGEIIINGKSLKDLVPFDFMLKEYLKPLELAGMSEGHDFTAKVLGGGSMAQLEAVRHGISRCIANINEDLKRTMRSNGLLTRDPREKERKKIYHVRARKMPQFSKR